MRVILVVWVLFGLSCGTVSAEPNPQCREVLNRLVETMQEKRVAENRWEARTRERLREWVERNIVEGREQGIGECELWRKVSLGIANA